MSRPRATKREPITIGDVTVEPGKRATIELPVARLFTGTQVSLTVVALHGRKPGPTVWLDAAIHGDELNGLRIIREVVKRVDLRRLSGTLLLVPVVNVFGHVLRSRYLPDRRDLNRSFPGSPRGSLAARLAHLFLEHVVSHCDFGIDLHTAGSGRTNLPHVRTDLADPESRRLAEVFGPPLIYHAPTIQGSLRQVAKKRGVRLLVFEAGEPLRFDDFAIEAGVAGVLRVLRHLGLWDTPEEELPPAPAPTYGSGAKWIRAGRSGIFVPQVKLGDTVQEGQSLGSVADAIPSRRRPVKAPFDGLVMGLAVDPLVHQGDALLHLVQVSDSPPDEVTSEGAS